MIEACLSNSDEAVINDKVEWKTILPDQKLGADTEHEYVKELTNPSVYSHIRLNIFPDGGVSRLRIFGKKKD